MNLGFPFNLYLVATAAAFFTTLLTLPFWRAWACRVGLVDDPGHRKIHATPIPLAGGWGVLAGLALPVALGAVAALGGFLPLPDAGSAHELLRYGVSKRGGQLAVILAGAFGMAMVGSLDDKYELRPARKFGGQFLIASLVALSGIRITLFVPSILFSYAVTILWILTITNALNFLDNMNGLCAGLGVIGAWACAWSAALQGQYLVAAIAFMTSGALLGFLPYNFPKATIFLGDAGSHLVGYLLAVLAILPHFYTRENPSTLAVFSPLLILAVPLLDMLWVVVHRWRIGQPFYLGDTNHLSHRLVKRGLSKTHAVIVIWLLAALGATAALLLL